MESTPIKLSRTRALMRKSAPLLGEDNDYVFKTLLGMDTSIINNLKSKGIIY